MACIQGDKREKIVAAASNDYKTMLERRDEMLATMQDYRDAEIGFCAASAAFTQQPSDNRLSTASFVQAQNSDLNLVFRGRFRLVFVFRAVFRHATCLNVIFLISYRQLCEGRIYGW